MREYHKIHSVYKRDQRGKFIEGQFSRPEFEALFHHPWVWTEKVDGMNVRIGIDDDGVYKVEGRTARAQFHPHLLERIASYGLEEKLRDMFGPGVTLVGEGYGPGIQKCGGTYGPNKDFILFDVLVNGVWLRREDVIDVGEKLGVRVVPIRVPFWTLRSAIENVGLMRSQIAEGAIFEGVVGVPVGEFRDRFGERIVCKVKVKDVLDMRGGA